MCLLSICLWANRPFFIIFFAYAQQQDQQPGSTINLMSSFCFFIRRRNWGERGHKVDGWWITAALVGPLVLLTGHPPQELYPSVSLSCLFQSNGSSGRDKRQMDWAPAVGVSFRLKDQDRTVHPWAYGGLLSDKRCIHLLNWAWALSFPFIFACKELQRETKKESPI